MTDLVNQNSTQEMDITMQVVVNFNCSAETFMSVLMFSLEKQAKMVKRNEEKSCSILKHVRI